MSANPEDLIEIRLTRAQLMLINQALSTRSGPHPCEMNRDLAYGTMMAVVDALGPKPACLAQDALGTWSSCDDRISPQGVDR